MYKREVFTKGKKYYFYYHNLRENGKIKNICLGSDLKEAKEKLSGLKKQNMDLSLLRFLRLHNKNTLLLAVIFLICMAYGFYSGNTTGFVTISAEIEQTATSYANITFNGTKNLDLFGSSVAAGDIDGDSLKDIIVGASTAEQVFVFFGADYSTTVNENAFSYANLTFNATGGSHVASGDINNDSYADIIVGTGFTQAFVIFGANYSDMYVNENASLYANLTFNGTGSPAFGFSVASGDINNDTYADVIAGAYNADVHGGADGQVFVFFGAEYPAAVNPINENAFSYANITLNATTDVGEQFGYSVASGDINNDTYYDIIVGAYDADTLGDSSFGGQAFVFFGADYNDGSAVNGFPLNAHAQGYANITINGTSDDGADKWLGTSVASGDINRDNYTDIIIGSKYADTPEGGDAGQVMVFFGADYTSAVSYDALPNANITINGTNEYNTDHLGSAETISSGDINCDGYADLIAAAFEAGIDDVIYVAGQVYVFYGADYTSPISQNASYSNITISGTEGDDGSDNVGSQLGYSVASGDIDNDNCAELIAGAPYANTSANSWAGQTYVFDFHEGVSGDNNAPTVTLNQPEDSTYISASTTFRYTVTDDTNLDTCELWGNWTGVWHLNESFVNPSNGAQNGSSTITLEEGSYLWAVYCNDTLNNYANTVNNYTLIVDSTTPVIVLDSPADSYSEGASGFVVFNYTAVSSGTLDTCELWSSWGSGWHLNETFVSPPEDATNGSSNVSIAEGSYVWNVWCNSTTEARLFNDTNYTLNVDLNPIINLESPENNTANTTTNMIDFTYNVTEYSSINSCNLTINDELNATSTSVTKNTAGQSFNNIYLYNGEYNWSVTCIDSQNSIGISETRNLSVSFDTTINDTSISLGSEYVFSSSDTGGANYVSSAALNGSKFVIAYSNESNKVMAVVGDVNGTEVTFGGVTNFDVPSVKDVSVAALNESTFVIGYVNTTVAGAVIGEVDGTSITLGTHSLKRGQTNANAFVSVATLNSTQFVIVYSGTFNDLEESWLTYTWAQKVNVNALSISLGTGSIANSEIVANTVAAFNSTKIIVVQNLNGNATIGNVTSTSSDYSATSIFNIGSIDNTGSDISSGTFNETNYVITYVDVNEGNNGTVIIGAVDNQDITNGSEFVFNPESTAYTSSAVLNETDFVVAYQDSNKYGAFVKCSIGGVNVASCGSETVFNTKETTYISLAKLNETAFMIAYNSSWGSGGKAVIANVGSEPIVSTSTTAAETTTSGTTPTDYSYPPEEEPEPEVPVEEVPIVPETEPVLETSLGEFSPEDVIPVEEFAYESVIAKGGDFSNGIKIGVSGHKRGVEENLTIYAITYDNKPKYMIDFDSLEFKKLKGVSSQCSNGVRDGGEEGVDCGGSCMISCTADIIVSAVINCGDGKCSAGEECYCSNDCGRLECAKVTFDLENLLAYLLLSLIIAYGLLRIDWHDTINLEVWDKLIKKPKTKTKIETKNIIKHKTKTRGKVKHRK